MSLLCIHTVTLFFLHYELQSDEVGVLCLFFGLIKNRISRLENSY